MRRKKEEPTIRERLSHLLDVPKEIVTDATKLSLVGHKELTIENYKGVIEYDAKLMKVNTGTYMVRLEGEGMEIQAITDESIIIRGRIRLIELIL